MWTLLFDTASPRPGIGLYRTASGAVPVFHEKALAAGSAELIPKTFFELLREAGVEVEEIGRIGVISGPGSFTGIRAGLAFARGLSRARGIPLLAVGTFEAAAAAAPEPELAIFILEAGRGEVHALERRQIGSSPRTVVREGLVESCQRNGLDVIEIGTFGLLRGAAELVVSRDPGDAKLAPMYGRPSAAEERFGPPGGTP